MCRTAVAPECIQTYNDLKLGRGTVKYVIYKLSDDFKEIVVEDQSNDPEYENFKEKLISSKTKDKSGKEGPGLRYAVYDFEYELASGEGLRFVKGHF